MPACSWQTQTSRWQQNHRVWCVQTQWPERHEIVPKARKSTLQAIIRGKVDLDSALHADGRRGYPGLVDVGYAKRFRVEHGRNEFVNEPTHSNGIASFWAYAKW
ncbi:transposase [Candidatus Spongiihabitans sp.]|uniref:transposase n=1 Tax=Candidatus Spongiihabitans sp. TaxID=3101308 RepID=UPI003C6F5088